MSDFLRFCSWLALIIINFHSVACEVVFPSNAIDTSEGDATLTFKNLHKCSCLANEVWFNGACQENVTTIQVLVELHPSKTEIIETNVIQNVEVGEISCPRNDLNLTLPGKFFALKTSGQIFNLNYGLSLEFSKYCVEHFYDAETNEVNLEVHMCISIPDIPVCCPADLYDSYYKNCSMENATETMVPFMLGGTMFESVTSGYTNNLKCPFDNRTVIRISEKTDNAHINLRDEGLTLLHTISQAGDTLSLPSSEYCINVENGTAISASYCVEDLLLKHQKTCQNQTCVRKCCPLNQVYDFEKFRCTREKLENRFKLEMYDDITLEHHVDVPKNLKMIVGHPVNCNFYLISPNTVPKDVFGIMSDGSLYSKNVNKKLQSHQYCIDNFKYGSNYVQEALICFEENLATSKGCKETSALSLIYPILLLISCVFLAITLVVYALIPDLHVKIQSKCLMANISSLLVGYVCLAIIQMVSQKLSLPVCIAFGLLTHFSILASFFWLNVMCFDIWRTLSSVNIGKSSPAGARKRYLKYSLYAWGCPLIITIVTTIMQTVPNETDNPNLILPQFGKSSCFIPPNNTAAQWVYIYGFISVLLFVNLCIFIHLAFILRKAQAISESALGKRNQLHKEWAKLYLKLFLIMGVSWIFEVASFVEGSCGVWVATDIINALRGVLICLVFVCKRDVFKKLMQQGNPAFARMTNTMRSSSSKFSRSSKRTSNFYVDPSSTEGTNAECKNLNNDDIKL